jgi:hypothetical protein
VRDSFTHCSTVRRCIRSENRTVQNTAKNSGGDWRVARTLFRISVEERGNPDRRARARARARDIKVPTCAHGLTDSDR